VVEGSPAYEIVKIANEEGVDLIVIATHSQSGWKQFLHGSVTEKVIKLAVCPVLTIQASKKE
jgi:nucleotide-binding universal stress UspA family protein